MEKKISLDYIEDMIVYFSIYGKHKEIILPAVIDYITDQTFLKSGNLILMEVVRDFYKDENSIPSLAEIFLFMNTDEKRKAFKDFTNECRIYKKQNVTFEKTVLLKYIEEFFRQRIITGVLSEAYIKQSTKQKIVIEEIYSEIEEAMSIHMMDDIGLNLFHDVDDYIKELISEDARIKTEFPWLDEQLGGGILSSGSVLYNFCAASNVGKSNFIKSLACNFAKQGKNCLVISLEMPRYIYANRFVAEMADISISKLKDKEESVATFLKSAKDNDYGDILIKDFATGSLTPHAMCSYIKRAQNSLDIKFDVIFVDYPELLKPSRVFHGRHDLTIANLYVETRALAFMLETPFIVVSQLNRDAYGKEKPSMENIGGAIGIMQCSDFGGFLYATDEMKETNQIGLSIGKSRFGAVNRSHRYNVDENTLKITESSRSFVDAPINIDIDGEEGGVEDANDVFENLYNLAD